MCRFPIPQLFQVVLGIWFGVGGGYASAADRSVGERPPSPLAIQVTVERGASAPIRLRSQGKPGQLIDFLVRTPPKHGVLTPAEGGRGVDELVVQYRHLGDGAVDTFTYAVRSAGSPVSIAATVTIRIWDRPPKLQVEPALLDFGVKKLGSPEERQFTLRNVGGGVLVGEILVPDGVKLDSVAAYELRAGDSRTWTATFLPHRIGRFREEIRVAPNAAGALTAIGNVQPLFGVDHSEQTLTLDPSGNGSRIGSTGIRNYTGEPLQARISGAEDLEVQLPAAVSVAPWGWSPVNFTVSGAVVTGGTTRVMIESGAQSESLVLRVPKSPARLEFEDAATSVQTVQAGLSTPEVTVEFRLINRGGEPANVTWRTARSHGGPSGRFTLEAQRLIRVPVTLQATSGSAVVEFASYGTTLSGTVHILPATAQTQSKAHGHTRTQTSPSQNAGPVEKALAPTEQFEGVGEPLTPDEAKLFSSLQNAFLGPPETGPAGPQNLTATNIYSTGATIVWESPPDSATSGGSVAPTEFRVELRRLTSGTSPTEPVTGEWQPLGNVLVERTASGALRAQLRGLQRDALHVIRVRAQLADGTWTGPSERLAFRTRRTEAERMRGPLLTAIGLAVTTVAAVLVWVCWRRHGHARRG